MNLTKIANNLTTEELFAFNLIPGIGSTTIQKLSSSEFGVDELRSNHNGILNSLVKGSRKEEAIGQIKSNYFHYLGQAQALLEHYYTKGIFTVSIQDPYYPFLYRKIPDPPNFLFLKGNKELLNYNKNVAVIGTRENSSQGAIVARNITEFFSSNGFNIVSGLAIGIDTVAHSSALDSKGLTTAILVDIEKISPSQNQGLAKKILDNGGLLLSENQPGSFVQKNSFVIRDRLQSGLSLAIFPIETDIKGGTMHTVNYAVEQQRLIFCPNYFNGTNDLSLLSNNPKVRGIKMLLDQKIALPFSKDTLEDAIKLLKGKFNTMFPHITEGELDSIFHLRIDLKRTPENKFEEKPSAENPPPKNIQLLNKYQQIKQDLLDIEMKETENEKLFHFLLEEKEKLNHEKNSLLMELLKLVDNIAPTHH